MRPTSQEISGGFLDNSDAPFLTAANFASAFQSYDGGGLLASDTAALTSIVGGAGNSFYDLSSLTPAAAHAGTWDGGHSTAGNSEIAFNNLVITTAGTITLTNIQILDDVSSIGAITVPVLNPDGSLGTAILENGGEAQGGIINMNNFAGLAPLNTPYALLAEGLPSDDRHRHRRRPRAIWVAVYDATGQGLRLRLRSRPTFKTASSRRGSSFCSCSMPKAARRLSWVPSWSSRTAPSTSPSTCRTRRTGVDVHRPTLGETSRTSALHVTGATWTWL